MNGIGYGLNGAIWGEEVLKLTFRNFERTGHLEEISMLGGDLCSCYPYRMLLSALSKVLSDDEIRDITGNHVTKMLPHKINELDIILKQARQQGIITTSSTGRILNSISTLLDLCNYRSYEGEPAMRLEAYAS